MHVIQKRFFRREFASALVVFASSLFVLLPPALVNEAPFWDDKAYINNALIASGRLDPSDAKGPYAEERQPLFWWFLTGIYLFNAPVETARLVSPVLTSLGLVAMFLLLTKIFDSYLAGLLATLFTLFLDYFVLTTSFILTDSFGSILAFLALLSFSLGLRYGPFLWLSGGLTALSIIARDQNLLLLPVMLLSFAWIAKTSKLVKIIYLGMLGAVGFSAIYMRQEVFLQILSDLLTPIVTDWVFLPLMGVFMASSILAVYKVFEQKNMLSKKPSIEERAFDMALGIALMLILLYPFFIDNVRLGAEFQIAGRGIFSRPVAHSIMVREDIARSGLDAGERIVFWLSALPSLFTAPLLLLSTIGVALALKNRVTIAKPLILWFPITVAYITVFTHVEYRFLVPALQPAAAFAGYAVSRIAMRNRWVAAGVASVVLLYVFLPTQMYGLVPAFAYPTTVNGWLTLQGYSQSPDRWLTDYINYLENVLKPPQLLISPINVITAWSTIPLIIATIYVSFKNPL